MADPSKKGAREVTLASALRRERGSDETVASPGSSRDESLYSSQHDPSHTAARGLAGCESQPNPVPPPLFYPHSSPPVNEIQRAVPVDLQIFSLTTCRARVENPSSIPHLGLSPFPGFVAGDA